MRLLLMEFSTTEVKRNDCTRYVFIISVKYRVVKAAACAWLCAPITDDIHSWTCTDRNIKSHC